ncbi:hypothetical protein [Dactylosporangium sp. NPDC051541]|uniref:hypothetical protein n=1 Tax=Dactylosporangium sp. NPDC051541 TaxID=3363977 RepID=UPI0037B1B27F
MTDAEKKIQGHRKAVRDHIDKYRRYPDPNDKKFALKTIQRVQGEITSLKRRKATIRDSWEDSWRPTNKP